MHKTLYRTYRPQTFEEVVGQDVVISTLNNAIKEDKIAHSYLLSGASGTGKTTIAKIFAKAINCSREIRPCNQCDICILINNEQTVDYVEIDAASNNGIDQIRNLIESIQYPPIVCKYKVYIIDEVHMLSAAAFNALLKTLEEPPTNSVFILATTEEHKIPETILTRCQRFNLQKISNREIARLVANVLEKEGKSFDDNATELIAEMAQGGARRALSISEQCMHLDKKITVDTINKAYGLLTTNELIELAQSIYSSDRTTTANILQNIHNKGTHYQRLLEEILVLFKEILVKDLKLEKFENKFVTNKNKNILSFNENFIFKAITLIQEALFQIKFSANPKLSFEILIFQLTKINEGNFNSKNIKPLVETKKEKEEISQQIAEVSEPKPIKVTPKKELLEEIKKETEELVDKENMEKIFQEPVEEFNEILNVLLAATKISREFFSKKWVELETITRSPANSKWVSILINSKVVAASKEAAIVMFDYEPSANVLNSKSTNQEFLKFIKHFFGREFLFIGTWKAPWEDERVNYKILKQANNLPKFKKIIIPKVKEKTITGKTELQEAKGLFGDLIEIEGVD